MTLSARMSPSGPKGDLQLPYYGLFGVDGTTPGNYFLIPSIQEALISAPQIEEVSAYLIPQNGKLGTFLVQNTSLGADAVNLTYQVRRNGVAVGSPVIIGNNASGPVKVDLSNIGVSAGDRVSIAITVPAFAGLAPVAKIIFTWTPNTQQSG